MNTIDAQDVAPQVPKPNATAPSNAKEDDPHKAVNFDLLVGHYYMSLAASSDDVVRAEYREMLDRWQLAEGNIASSYFCTNIAAAVVTTDRQLLFSAGDPFRKKADLPLYKLITRADHLAQFARESLIGAQRRAAIEDIYAIETSALACMDDLAADPAPSAEVAQERRTVTYAKVEADLAEAERYVHAAWQRRAQVAYLAGMGLGIIGVAGVVLLCAVLLTPLLTAFSDIPPRIAYVPWVLLLGAVGAGLSVMQRLTAGKLHLRLDSSLTENRTLGAFRPIVGAALGLAIFILVQGRLVPIEIPVDDMERPFFFAGLAFLAGFSERFAQDMIGVGKSIRPSSPDAQGTASEKPDEEPRPQ